MCLIHIYLQEALCFMSEIDIFLVYTVIMLGFNFYYLEIKVYLFHF